MTTDSIFWTRLRVRTTTAINITRNLYHAAKYCSRVANVTFRLSSPASDLHPHCCVVQSFRAQQTKRRAQKHVRFSHQSSVSAWIQAEVAKGTEAVTNLACLTRLELHPRTGAETLGIRVKYSHLRQFMVYLIYLMQII